MNISLDAIYEDGVLKPLKPVPLLEHQRVQVTIQAGTPTSPEDADQALLVRQQIAINELLAEVRNLPCPSAADGFSSSNHDEVLYRRPA